MEEIEEIKKEFFEKDGDRFLADLESKAILVAEYQAEQYHQKDIGPWWEVWEPRLFWLFKESKKQYTKKYTKKDRRGLHELKIFEGPWIVFETSIRTTICTHRFIYIFYLP